MRSFASYISKHLASFVAFILILLFLNTVVYSLTFQKIMTEDYRNSSPQSMLEMTADAATPEQLSDNMIQKLRQNHIWAIYLNANGQSYWSVDLPDEVPESYTIQDVALFSKGYIEDYPVFVWNTNDGLLVLGYPKDSYTKLTSNYYSIAALRRLPIFVLGMLGLDVLCLFCAYYFSKRKIIRNIEPIVSAVETLGDGKPVSVCISGELSKIANSVNKASSILNRQNEARANWISGVSHDIRTPLSMIMGYANRIAENESANKTIREQAEIVQKQSVKIKELVQDLNLVSQLEYEMQPLHKEVVRLSKLLRSYVADLLNTGISDSYIIGIQIDPDAENAVLECDARLISRAVNNLVHNSMKHNPLGCRILLSLSQTKNIPQLIVQDDGVGLSEKKLQELKEKPHYLECTDERLDLRHGLGLVLVRQIVAAHGGTMTIDSKINCGCKITLIFSSTDSIQNLT